MFVTLAAFTIASACLGQAASFQGLGQLSGYTQGSFATDISGDGAIVVGYAQGLLFDQQLGSYIGTEAWRWQSASLTGLGHDPGTRGSRAVAISRDGTCIIGTESQWFGFSGWVWRTETRSPLASPVGPFQPLEVNSDGSTIVGQVWALDRGAWVQPGLMVPWQTLCSGFPGGRMVDVADNGIVAFDCPSGLLATDGSFLVPPPIGAIRKINSDASVVLGDHPWRRGQPFQFMGNFFEDPRDISDTGEWVVGAGTINGSGPAPFIIGARVWSNRTGIRTLECVLRENGVLPAGWQLTAAVGISDDGTVIIGNGVNPAGIAEAWRAVLPFVAPSPDHNRNGLLSVEDLFSFLEAYFQNSFTADYSGDAALSVGDIFRFLEVYFAGCV